MVTRSTPMARRHPSSFRGSVGLVRKCLTRAQGEDANTNILRDLRRQVQTPNPSGIVDAAIIDSTLLDTAPAELKPVTDLYERVLGRHWQALPARFKIVAACSLSFVICNMDKVNMSVAIIPMSQEFGWSSSVAGLVQSSFFYGYMLVQLPGGYLASRFGGSLVLPAAVTVWSVATALVPPLATTIPSLCASRALVGLGEGAAPSAATDMIVKVVAPDERARAVSVSFGGLQVGSILGLLASPVLIDQFGWQSVFYAFGAAGVIWAVWFRSVLADPSEDMTSLVGKLQTKEQLGGEAIQVPWRGFLRNRPVRALMFTHMCHNWMNYTTLAWLPSYFKETLSMDLFHASALCLLPPITSIVISSVSCQVADHYISKGVKVAYVRKTAQSGAFLIPAACLLGASQLTGSYWSVMLLSLALGASSLSLCGLYCTHQDISPKYASVLLGLTNTSGSIPGIVGVTAVGTLLDATHSWSIALFAPTIVLFLLGTAVYTQFGENEPQDFSDNSPFEWEGKFRALLPGQKRE